MNSVEELKLRTRLAEKSKEELIERIVELEISMENLGEDEDYD